MSNASETVDRLIEAWRGRDLAAIADCFTEDAVWHNMPYPPIAGREAVVAAIGRFLYDVAGAEFLVHHSGEIAPGMVVNERNDIFLMTDGRTIDIPVMGVFEVSGDHIRAWRDYFDPATMNA